MTAPMVAHWSREVTDTDHAARISRRGVDVLAMEDFYGPAEGQLWSRLAEVTR
jgi:hypothetical protein